MIRAGLLMLAILVIPQVVRAGQVMTATSELLAETLPGVSWQSVGLVLVKKTKKQRIYSTGFFLTPTLFVVSDSPFNEEEPKACKKETLIFTGKLSVNPDFELKTEKPTHRCQRIVRNDVWRGYEVWEVEALEGSVPVAGIPLLTHAIAEEANFDPEGEKTTLLGYTFGANGAELKLVTDCRYQHLDSPFSPEDVAEKDDLRKVRFDWSSINCPLESGMQGGPIFAQLGNEFFAVGIATGVVRAEGGKSLILTPFFPRVTKYFGEYLKGAHE